MKVITIGRSTENNDIVVDDVKVSRNHLQMVMDDNGNYSVVDLGSTNGTYVNGQRISGEVRLQPGDEVRIGQTVLPWQNYFATPIVESPLSTRPPKGPNRTWLYAIIGAALLLLIGGGVAWKIHHDNQKEKLEQEKNKKEQEKEQQLEQEANDARVEAARLSEEAEAAARKAAETQSEKDLQYAKQMHEKAQEAEKIAQEKEAEWNKMKEDLEAANEAKQAAENKSAEDAKAKEEAEKNAKQAQDEAAKAKQAQAYAEETTKLTKEFYGLISKIKPKEYLHDSDYFGEICKKMNWNPGKKDDKKAFIESKFNEADNVGKRIIIIAIKEVLGQQANDEKSVDTETEAPIEDNEIEQSAPMTNDSVKQ